MPPQDPNASAPAHHQVPTVVDDNQRALRLQFSTVKNADAFGSIFTGDSIFELQNPRRNNSSTGRTMIVATHQNDDKTEEAEWLGTLSILPPASVSERPRDKPLPLHIVGDIKEKRAELYIIIGVWVNPEYRRRGIGSALLRQALEMIRLLPAQEDRGDIFSRVGDESKAMARTCEKQRPVKLVMLHVRENNDDAREMYEKVGFVVERGVNEIDIQESNWMSMYIYQ